MKKRFLLSTACLALCAGVLLPAGKAGAQEMGSLSYYALSEAERREHYNEWRVFLEYNLRREQCQHYQEPPAGYVLKGCDVYRVGSVADIQPRAGDVVTTTTTTAVIPPEPVKTDETIYFDWDMSNIRESEKWKLENIINAIKGSNPAQVTVAGHADRSGPVDYNQELSERRASTVTDEMVMQGVSRDVITQEAHGEMAPAVPTDDGIRLQENRRAVIKYNR